MKIRLAGAIVNLIGNLILIPFYRSYGAAIATLLSFFVSSYAALWLIPEFRHLAEISFSVVDAPNANSFRREYLFITGRD